ncbi:MAG: M28 family peptidase [Bacteroidetes bacterium]|nr:M28 family peptidase [Bacteroidota bacterium]
MFRMPNKTYAGPLPPLTNEERAIRDAIRHDVERLASEIGERNIQQYTNLCAAADFIELSFEQAGYEVKRQSYEVMGRTCYNIEVEISGNEQTNEIVIVGAHYDTVFDCPGANDNASGVAALLALAKVFSGKKISRSLRFVAFVNEEPPFFQSGMMGSMVYARRCKERHETIVAMLSLETIGYYSEQANSQHYPFPVGFFYPSIGNFVAVVGNLSSGGLVRKVIASFRRQVQFPSEGGAWPGIITGVGWSDHWAFWKMGYSAIMITDTALFRYPYYHSALDTPDRICYDHLTHVVEGLKLVLVDLVGVGNKH